MTIIQPSKNKSKLSPIILVLIIFVIAGFYIYEYNRLVSFNFQIRSLEKTLVDYQTLNSERKRQSYQLVDSARLEELAKERGLVLDQQPQYLGVVAN